MAKGLDVGTMNIVGSYLEGKKTVLRHQRNLFLELEASDVTGQMLSQANILHMKTGDGYIIVGEDALTFANVLNVDSRRPMKQGILSRDEKQAIPMMRLIMERMLGPPAHEGEVAYYTSPGPPVDGKKNIIYHQKVLEAVLRKIGYTPHVVNEGLCVIYAEMQKQQFTGMGISCGAGMVNVALAHLGVPLASFSVQRGGDWIDYQVSEATGLVKDKVTAAKEKNFRLDKREGLDQVQAALAIYYENLINYSVAHIENELRRANVEEGLSVPVVITGGTSSPPGFVEAYEKRLRAARLPFEIESVRGADTTLYTVTMGALVGARAYEAELRQSGAVAR